jgi:hypothetical protein
MKNKGHIQILSKLGTSKIVEKILKNEYLNWGYERHDLDKN